MIQDRSPAPTPEEAAAIAAALGAYLADEEHDGEEEVAVRDQWSFAGRLRALDRQPTRLSRDAPRDPWTASGRLERL